LYNFGFSSLVNAPFFIFLTTGTAGFSRLPPREKLTVAPVAVLICQPLTQYLTDTSVCCNKCPLYIEVTPVGFIVDIVL
jgi:hypothetical protein